MLGVKATACKAKYFACKVKMNDLTPSRRPRTFSLCTM